MEALAAGAVVLGILVIAHETGHLIAGLRLGVTVLKFSIGFGPKVVGFTWRDIEWAISAIPLGGFVKFAGEEVGASEEQEEQHEPDPGDFAQQPWWVKIIVAVAGPGMNIVLAFFLLFLAALIGLQVSDPDLIVGSVEPASRADLVGFVPGDRIVEIEGSSLQGWFDLVEHLSARDESAAVSSLPIVVVRNAAMETLYTVAGETNDFLEGIALALPPIVGEVTIGFPAFEAGIQEGDSIISADGAEILSYEELRDVIREKADREVELQFIRDDRVLTTTVTPLDGATIGQNPGGLIGIIGPEGNQRTVRLGFSRAMRHAAEMTTGMIGDIYSGLYRMVQNPRGLRRQLGGPIAIAQLSARQARKGIDSILNFIAVISVMLAVVNLLPIPILDGGMVLFSLIEGIRRQPLSVRSQLILQRIGFAFLVCLMAFSLVNDLGRVWQRHKAVDKPVETESPQSKQDEGDNSSGSA